MKKFLKAAILAATCVTGAAALDVATADRAHAACVTGVASWDVLWIRRGPSTRFGRVGAIPSDGCGVSVNWNACRGWWCPVYFRGVSGWAHTRYLYE